MKRPRARPWQRLKRYRKALLCVLVPPLIWSAILIVLPTEWARALLVERLSKSSGRSVQLGSLRVGLLGGLRLEGLEIGEPGGEGDPWLRADRLQIDLSLLHLAVGLGDPSRVEADGLTLRVHRFPDGSFEFGDLLASHPASPPPGSTAIPASGPDDESAVCPMELVVRRGRVSVIDDPNATRFDCEEIQGRGTWDGRRAMIHELHGALNGGRLDLAAQLDRGPEGPAFEGQVRTDGIALDVEMGALNYLIPVLGESSESSVGARLDLDLYVRGQGATAAEVRRTLVGRGTLTLDPIRLDGSEVLADLAGLLHQDADDAVGSVRSQFVVGQGRVVTDTLVLEVARIPLLFSGWTDFQGRLDYRVKQDGLAGRVADQARDLLADLQVDVDELLAVRVHGTVDHLVVTVDGVPLDGSPADDRTRLRQIGHRLRDRIFH